MADKFANVPDDVSAPARKMFVITPGPNPIDPLPKAIRANAAGSITLQAVESDAPVTLDMAAGETLPVRAVLVTAAGMLIHGYA